MNKRGDVLTYIWTFYLILILILSYGFYTWINSKSTGEDFKNNYLGKDIALTLNTIYNSNGDLKITYKNLKDYNLVIDNKNMKLIKNGNVKENSYTPDNYYNNLKLDLKIDNNLVIENNKEIKIKNEA